MSKRLLNRLLWTAHAANHEEVTLTLRAEPGSYGTPNTQYIVYIGGRRIASACTLRGVVSRTESYIRGLLIKDG